MTDIQAKPKILTSDPKVLHKIKYAQFRTQVVPLGVIVLLLIIGVLKPFGITGNILFYPTLAAFGWYLVARILFRTKSKILVPEATAFVSPVDGKVSTYKTGENATLMTIRKSFLDVVELRLPYPDLQIDNESTWNFETPQGKVSIRITAPNIKYFENTGIHGSVIGLIPSSAIFTFHLPEKVKVLVKEKQAVFGGETVLFDFAEIEETTPKNILVDEVEPELT
jgi:hypothetical protein